MNDIVRRSPVAFEQEILQKEVRDGFEIVTEYRGEDEGPWLVDLSHQPKYDIQSGNLDEILPFGLKIPESVNQGLIFGSDLICRQNRSQAFFWSLEGGGPDLPEDPWFTDVSDGFCLLAIVGMGAFDLMERITPLDMADPNKTSPYLVQGPVLGIPCRTVVLSKEESPLIFLSFSVGYGQSVSEALLDAGKELGFRPGGEKVFQDWLSGCRED